MSAATPSTTPSALGGGPGRGRRSRRRLRRLILIAPLFVLLVLVVLFGVGYATTRAPAASDVVTAQKSIISYADGKTELGRIGTANRTDVPLDRVPVDVRNAVLAAEDRNYYSEPGVSITGISRALIANIRGGSVAQGGSTITQQYAKNAYLSSERTFTRKIREVFIAIKLDGTRSKNEIFEDYLNTIYFGRGAYGIQAAAETYFSKPVDRLSLAEAAVLAASISSPGGYDPVLHGDAARDRWHYVLEGMVKKGWLDPGRASTMTYPPLGLRKSTGNVLGGPKGYLIRQVQDELLRNGFSEDDVTQGGLRVTTTIDKKAQDAAVAAVEGVLGGRAPDDLRQGLVAVEPKTGRITAEYAGRDYVTVSFNWVTQGDVQPGSSFKPFVLLAALRQGIGLRSTYDGRSPQTFAGVTITNFGAGTGEQYGQIDLVEATAHSVNTVYVPLALDAGLTNVVKAATDAGITSPIDVASSGVSVALGGFGRGVHPIDEAAAYATFAARGERADPHIIERVTDVSGKVLFEPDRRTTRAFAPDVIDDATYAMTSVVDRGTATNAVLAGDRPAAGKTGTTSENTAAWFSGYTPQLAATMVLYRDNNAPLQGIAGVNEVTGGTLPAQIWKRFMDAALRGEPVQDFPPPTYVGSGRNAGTSPPTGGSATPTVSSPSSRTTPPGQRRPSGLSSVAPSLATSAPLSSPGPPGSTSTSGEPGGSVRPVPAPAGGPVGGGLFGVGGGQGP